MTAALRSTSHKPLLALLAEAPPEERRGDGAFAALPPVLELPPEERRSLVTEPIVTPFIAKDPRSTRSPPELALARLPADSSPCALHAITMSLEEGVG
jgi:hypothetical protein